MRKVKITEIKPRIILDSSGGWTVEVQLTLADGRLGVASTPTGISAGKKEVKKTDAVAAVDCIIHQIALPIWRQGRSFDQASLDAWLSKRKLPSNATLPVSVAFAKAVGFFNQNLPSHWQPKIMMLLFEGGLHGSPSLPIQEVLAVVDSVEEGVSYYQKIKMILENQQLGRLVGQEGGFSPPGWGIKQVFSLLEKVGVGRFALDLAAEHQNYSLQNLKRIVKLGGKRLLSIEDPASRQKWKTVYALIKRLNPRLFLVGDDLTVSQVSRIKKFARLGLIDGVVIKPDQVGTISQAIAAAKVARQMGLFVVVSHRGRETNDTWIVDFARKVAAEFVKFGAPARGERVAKYNRLRQFSNFY